MLIYLDMMKYSKVKDPNLMEVLLHFALTVHLHIQQLSFVLCIYSRQEYHLFVSQISIGLIKMTFPIIN